MAQAAIYVGRGTSNLSVRATKVMLEEMGVEVALVNAKDASAASGRKQLIKKPNI